MRYTVLLPVLCVFHILCLSAFEVSKKTNSKADISFPKFLQVSSIVFEFPLLL